MLFVGAILVVVAVVVAGQKMTFGSLRGELSATSSDSSYSGSLHYCCIISGSNQGTCDDVPYATSCPSDTIQLDEYASHDLWACNNLCSTVYASSYSSSASKESSVSSSNSESASTTSVDSSVSESASASETISTAATSTSVSESSSVTSASESQSAISEKKGTCCVYDAKFHSEPGYYCSDKEVTYDRCTQSKDQGGAGGYFFTAKDDCMTDCEMPSKKTWCCGYSKKQSNNVCAKVTQSSCENNASIPVKNANGKVVSSRPALMLDSQSSCEERLQNDCNAANAPSTPPPPPAEEGSCCKVTQTWGDYGQIYIPDSQYEGHIVIDKTRRSYSTNAACSTTVKAECKPDTVNDTIKSSRAEWFTDANMCSAQCKLCNISKTATKPYSASTLARIYMINGNAEQIKVDVGFGKSEIIAKTDDPQIICQTVADSYSPSNPTFACGNNGDPWNPCKVQSTASCSVSYHSKIFQPSSGPASVNCRIQCTSTFSCVDK